MGDKLDIFMLSDWCQRTGDTLVISGPCSAESEEQVMQTALGVKECNVDVLRAGIWKPRTRPGSFEGVGRKGLKWLKKARRATNLPVTVEVANSEHVEECLEHEIDILWIGARSAANPFTVEGIARVLNGIDIPVLVKNPINPDLELWIGALERLNRVGIKKLAAIHRGFSSYKKSLYRNEPNWRIPVELRRRHPNLPIICDPSHICGNRELLSTVMQKAMDLLFDGLMIECHVDPESALSDSKQQVTPDQLKDLLSRLQFKALSTDDMQYHQRIEELRETINEIDDQVVTLFAKRMEVSTEIGRYKKKSKIAILQPERWEEIVQTRIKAGMDRNLSEDFVFNIYQFIHEESIRKQEEASEREER